ncbi:MAG: peptidoglycan-binding domain-containing protein [Myxococcota bacterium]
MPVLLDRGSRGQSVVELQRSLRAAGFNPGGIDGVFGDHTRAAVVAFQRANGLSVDGVVGADTSAMLRRALQVDRFDSTPTPSISSGADRTAVIHGVSRRGQRDQLVTGQITINGNSYTFRSGGHARGSLPTGDYEVTPHLWSRSNASMTVGGVGYSFAMSDKYDPRVGATRRLLRIHPDGASPGTEGCMGIVGDAATQRRFREDMRAELARNGGRFTLSVR